jgi:hypothetical protein
MSDFMKPTREDATVTNRSASSREHQKRRLKCVFGIVVLAKNVAASAQDHGPVAFHQKLECTLRRERAAIQELLEQNFVGKFVGGYLDAINAILYECAGHISCSLNCRMRLRPGLSLTAKELHPRDESQGNHRSRK